MCVFVCSYLIVTFLAGTYFHVCVLANRGYLTNLNTNQHVMVRVLTCERSKNAKINVC